MYLSKPKVSSMSDGNVSRSIYVPRTSSGCFGKGTYHIGEWVGPSADGGSRPRDGRGPRAHLEPHASPSRADPYFRIRVHNRTLYFVV